MDGDGTLEHGVETLTTSGGNFDRLAMVFLRRFPSRQAWRSRMAGFPDWLGSHGDARKWELQNAFCANHRQCQVDRSSQARPLPPGATLWQHLSSHEAHESDKSFVLSKSYKTNPRVKFRLGP